MCCLFYSSWNSDFDVYTCFALLDLVSAVEAICSLLLLVQCAGAFECRCIFGYIQIR
jgi:hypothetical protein